MSTPNTSAPSLAAGNAVVPSPHPRSRTSRPFVIPRPLTTASPLSLIVSASRVKSPFSQSALFGFIATFPPGQSNIDAPDRVVCAPPDLYDVYRKIRRRWTDTGAIRWRGQARTATIWGGSLNSEVEYHASDFSALGLMPLYVYRRPRISPRRET